MSGAQGVVERASAQLSKRINGLRRGKSGGVVERVTTALCGSVLPPEKPARFRPKPPVPPPRRTAVLSHRPSKVDELLVDEYFLAFLFKYFTPGERRVLAQVCTKWRDVLYRGPRYWSGILPVVHCRELKTQQERVKLYSSFVRRGFHSLALLSATDEDVVDLVDSYPLSAKQLNGLSLRCSSVTDRGLETLIDHLQALYELELAGCNEITEAGLWSCLTPRIVSLTLSDCINVADEAIGAVAQLLPSLYEFSLQAYHVTDAALGFFSPKQSSSINVLRLHSCWEITNHGIVNIVHSLPNLTVLSLSGCSKVTDEGVELIAENLQKLRCLDLSWCSRITDAALEYIACDLNTLEELTLDRCVHITDIGIGYVSTMLSLTALFLRWCSQVRDFGVHHLCGMQNLQVLSLAGKLVDEVVIVITFKFLNLVGGALVPVESSIDNVDEASCCAFPEASCPLLSSSGLSSLIQLRHLRELELTNCPGATRELFDYLREHLPRCLVIE